MFFIVANLVEEQPFFFLLQRNEKGQEFCCGSHNSRLTTESFSNSLSSHASTRWRTEKFFLIKVLNSGVVGRKTSIIEQDKKDKWPSYIL